jgi:hypothetical protein
MTMNPPWINQIMGPLSVNDNWVGRESSHMKTHLSVLALYLVFIEMGLTAASAQSCNSKESCRDKLITLATCTVSISSENMHVRTLPNARAQAVGILSNGDKVYVNDQQELRVFVEGFETDDKGRQTMTGNAGWILRSSVNNCRNVSPY